MTDPTERVPANIHDRGTVEMFGKEYHYVEVNGRLELRDGPAPESRFAWKEQSDG